MHLLLAQLSQYLTDGMWLVNTGSSNNAQNAFLRATYLRETSSRTVRTRNGITAGARDATCVRACQRAHGRGARSLIRVVIRALGIETSLQRARPNKREKDSELCYLQQHSFKGSSTVTKYFLNKLNKKR